MDVKICDGCGYVEKGKEYFAQMKNNLPITGSGNVFTYNTDKDLCSTCIGKLGRIIKNFFDSHGV